MEYREIDFRFERLKLNIRKRLYDFGKMSESQLRNYFKDHYEPEQVTQAIDELCTGGFCGRVATSARQASVVVLLEKTDAQNQRQ